MAHKPTVSINQTWQNLTSLIAGYSATNEYNIQLLSQGKAMFCISASEPTTQSYTITSQYDIVNLAKGVVGCWVKMNDALTGKLSIEEV
jgi:hypothetical protein